MNGILGTVAFAYVIIFCAIGLTSLVPTMALIGSVFLFAIVLNRGGFYAVSKFSTIFCMNFGIFYYSSVLGQRSGAQMVYYAAAWLPLVLFEISQKKRILICSFLSVMCYILLEITDYELFSPVFLNPVFQKFFYFLLIITTFLINFLGVLFFYIETMKAKSRLEEANNELSTEKHLLQDAYNDLKENKLTIERLQQQASYATLTRGIAHEIRNPIGMILSCWEIVSQNLHRPEVVAEFSTGIEENIDRVLNITDTMLDYGRTGAREKKDLDLNKEIQKTIDLAKAKAGIHGVTFVFEPEKIPMIKADATALSQIFTNLILNAIEAIAATERIGTITIRTCTLTDLDTQKNSICIRIKDTGPGIPKDIQLKIFDTFYTTKHESHGLGLSMVFKLVADHHGAIEVLSDSEVEAGTTFVVRMPVSA